MMKRKLSLNKAFKLLDSHDTNLEDKEKAQKIIDNEYDKSRRIESEFYSYWLISPSLSLEDAIIACNIICKHFKCKPVKAIKYNVNLPKSISGQYVIRHSIIELRPHHNSVQCIMHELAHHFIYSSPTLSTIEIIKSIFQTDHGDLFLRELKRIFDFLLSAQEKNKDRIYSMGCVMRRQLSVVDLLKDYQ